MSAPQAPGDPRTPSRTRLPAAIWTLGFVSLLMDVSSELIHSLLPVFLVSVLGASAFTVGLIEGAGESTALIVRVFSGAFSDAWGKRKSLAAFGYGLAALSKPLFALATGGGLVLAARVLDRIGKGIRGAPRDALIADITPPALRGAAFGLRQSLDTVGAFVGPLLAMALMFAWNDAFRAVFWVALAPAALSFALIVLGVREPDAPPKPASPRGSRARWREFDPAFWWVVAIGAASSLPRFSEAFLILRAQGSGLPVAWVPMVLIVMNVVYALGAYPLGRLSDRIAPVRLLAAGMGVLIGADLFLASSDMLAGVWAGIALWGVHLALTQGLFARMIADSAPPQQRGTAFGIFNFVGGVAMLLSNALAGLVWDSWGAATTFLAGAAIALIAFAAALLHGGTRAARA